MSIELERPPSWVADAVFYQVFPDRFARSGRVPAPGPFEAWDAPPTALGIKGGDLYGVIDHLDHLADLGVTAIYLNPVFASASNHRYHPFDYLAVDPILGGDDALSALVDAVHVRGMRLILDAVFNHASRGFWPFHHVLETGRHSPYRDWFLLDTESLEAGRPLRAYPDRLQGELAPDWGEAHAAGTESLRTLGYRAWWDLPALPKLNTDNPIVREYLMGVAEHWTRFGIDGWRLDVPGEITTPGFWEEFRRRVRAINPDAYIVGEVWQQRGDLLDGTTFDGLMNYPLASVILNFVPGTHRDERVVAQQAEIARATRTIDGDTFLATVERIFSSYRDDAALALLNLIDSHDTPRFLSLCGGDTTSLRLAWLVLLTLPGAPCIYYGDEVGMTGEMDPGCRGAFPWRDHPSDGELLGTARALIALRHASPALRSRSFEPLASVAQAAAYRRGSGRGSVVVAINAGSDDAELEVDVSGMTELSLPGLPGAAQQGDAGRFRLPKRSARVFRLD